VAGAGVNWTRTSTATLHDARERQRSSSWSRARRPNEPGHRRPLIAFPAHVLLIVEEPLREQEAEGVQMPEGMERDELALRTGDGPMCLHRSVNRSMMSSGWTTTTEIESVASRKEASMRRGLLTCWR
jgi:hypothetical protein